MFNLPRKPEVAYVDIVETALAYLLQDVDAYGVGDYVDDDWPDVVGEIPFDLEVRVRRCGTLKR